MSSARPLLLRYKLGSLASNQHGLHAMTTQGTTQTESLTGDNKVGLVDFSLFQLWITNHRVTAVYAYETRVRVPPAPWLGRISRLGEPSAQDTKLRSQQDTRPVGVGSP